MFVNWDDIQKALSPIKDYQDLCQRLRKSFSFPFVRQAYNLSLPKLLTYTSELLGGDSRQRYTEYVDHLTRIIRRMDQSGMPDVLTLIYCVAEPRKFEAFTAQQEINPLDTISLVKYLVYWFIPAEKYLGGLVRMDPGVSQAVKTLQGAGIRTNLEILQAGLTAQDRDALVRRTGLTLSLITELVNRADFSRLPWASKATISNIIGSGYSSMAELVAADPLKLYADYFSYGKSIGKNLKLGNEIENSYRIARIVPKLVTN